MLSYLQHRKCNWEDKVSTEWVLHNLKPEYKVIVVGDATMGPAERWSLAVLWTTTMRMIRPE